MNALRTVLIAVALALLGPAMFAWADYADELAAWRKRAEDSLRSDLGWLTIAGRWELGKGDNTLGSAPGNDVVLPKELSPPHLGRIRVGADGVKLMLAPGVRMWLEPRPGQRGADFSERKLETDDYGEEWVSMGRLSLTVYTPDNGKTILRIADRESPNRKRFAGRIWYPANGAVRVPAQFVAYPAGTKIPIANVRGEITDEDVAGYVEFELLGRKTRLDALREDDGTLFLIIRDATSGVTTYPAARFIHADAPVNGRTIVDFNKAYNPPCAFSAYTTCPLPPPQNWLRVAVEAGEKYAAPRDH
ncbi:MAG TPA: DUF1684 domain-containing protein [Casimicrobiaceae bacterium]|nr:DUF1684 domain-containing protein [Casimicrobiaceae bacterium]